MPAAELSAVEAAIAQAFPEPLPNRPCHPPRRLRPRQPLKQHPALPDIDERPVQDAAPGAARAAPAPEPAAAPAPETEPAADLPPVDLDLTFDTDEFLFDEDATEAVAEPARAESPRNAGRGQAPPPAIPKARARKSSRPPAAQPEAETRPDPLIPIKAMCPEERIALFS